MRRPLALLALAGVITFAACDTANRAMTAHTNVLARAAGLELEVDEAASLLAQNPRLPAEPAVVEAIANLWVDYTLLGRAALEDTTFQAVELEPQIRPFVEQRLVWKLREQVVSVDTAITEEELRTLYEEDRPGTEVRARHILLRTPQDADGAERDSVLALAEELRARAASGADFAELAREYSEDPGSAQRGGDLGFFGRGQMVAPFEEAAFRLEPGQVSEVVETPFGYHIIKVEERRSPAFEDVREEFRSQVLRERIGGAEEAYLEELTGPLDIQVREGALDVARELAQEPGTELGRRAASRALVEYRGGQLTAGEYASIIRRSPPSDQARLAQATDEQLEAVLLGLTRNRILVEEARRQGLELSSAERDSLELQARQQLRTAASAAGFLTMEAQGEETDAEVIERKVRDLLEGIISQRRRGVPLGPAALALRDQYGGEVFERAIPAVIEALEERRDEAAAPQEPIPAPPGVEP